MAKKAKKKAAVPAEEGRGDKQEERASSSTSSARNRRQRHHEAAARWQRARTLPRCAALGCQCPQASPITTEVCTYYYDHKRSYPPALQAQMKAGIAALRSRQARSSVT
jgi:pyruvate,orthophosphate dikinase